MKTFDDYYTEAIMYWQNWIIEQNVNMRFYLGDQWKLADKKYLNEQHRAALVFNKIRRVVHMLSGYQKKNRLALTVQANNDAVAPIANDMSAVLMFIMANGGYEVMSAAFSGMLKTGLAFVYPYVDYADDPVSGDIKLKRIAYNAILIDPFTTQKDLSDCSYMMSRRYVSKEIAKILIPSAEKEIDVMPPEKGDGKFNQLAQRHKYAGYYIDELYRSQMVNRKIIVNMQTGEYHDWDGKEKAGTVTADKMYKIVTLPKRIIKKTVYVNGREMLEENAGSKYPYIPVWGFFDPEYDVMYLKLQGIIQSMRDPQTEINKRRSKMLDIIDNQISSGWVVGEDALVNPKAPYRTGSNQVIAVKRGHSINEVQRLPQTDIPAGLFQLNQLFEQDIMEIPGVNTEMFGQPSKDYLQEASLLAKMRQSSGLTLFQDLFDNYRFAKKMLGEVLIDKVISNYTPDKVSEIIGHQPAQQFYDKEFMKYKVEPEEGVLTDSQREMYYSQLLALKQLGAPINWETIIAASPIQGQQAIKETMAKDAQAAAAAAAEADQQREAMNKLLQTKAVSNIAASEEKRAKAMLETENAKLAQVKLLTQK